VEVLLYSVDSIPLVLGDMSLQVWDRLLALPSEIYVHPMLSSFHLVFSIIFVDSIGMHALIASISPSPFQGCRGSRLLTYVGR